MWQSPPTDLIPLSKDELLLKISVYLCKSASYLLKKEGRGVR